MRLICPGCAAQYEVMANAIPADGRDVQCSNCGQTWFQRGPLSDGTLPHDRDDAILAGAVAPDTKDAPEPAVRESWADLTGDAHEASQSFGAQPGAEPPEGADQDAPDPDAPPNPARKIDDAVLSVLREEAQREARARRAEAASIEIQPDLGLALQPQAIPRRPTARVAKISDPIEGTSIAELRAKRAANAKRPDPYPEDTDFPEDESAASTRRNRLPDIEEINSTLRGTSERDGRAALSSDVVYAERNARRGFKLGFLSVVVLGVMALLVYALAAPIAGAVPGLGPVLDSYVAALDGLRLWVSAQSEAAMRALLAWLS